MRLRRRLPGAAVVVIGIVAISAALAATQLPRLSAGPSPGASNATAPGSAAGSGPFASAPAATTVITSSPAASPSPSLASPGPSGPPAAPTNGDAFKLRKTIVPIAFPLPARPTHRYLDGWLVPRVGSTYPYEEARGRAADGTLLRAHDGVDIAIPVGVPVLAVFDGIVVDPRTRWKPWDPARYGKVVVIQSTESTSTGYYAISAHLSTLAVKVGDAVKRGEVVGRTGRTGNAATAPVAHLHFELRAPFTIEQHWGGVRRRLDVFDPKPSLLAADPARA